MDAITLQNYRCFGSEAQTARLAPLTLLVGLNSTGKTSFLALTRALWDVAFREIVPNFRESPYDLGPFSAIVHQGVEEIADSFLAGFAFNLPGESRGALSFEAVFKERADATVPAVRKLSQDKIQCEIRSNGENEHTLRFSTERGYWSRRFSFGPIGWMSNLDLLPISMMFWERFSDVHGDGLGDGPPEWAGSPQPPSEKDMNEIHWLTSEFRRSQSSWHRPEAGAPIRSHPRRTYDPIQLTQDPEGGYVPSYLAGLYRSGSDEWRKFKQDLEKFGQASGMFDEIAVRDFGTTSGDPFQLQVRKFGKCAEGPLLNLIDVGYGVSQVLPIVTELLNEDSDGIVLLQQPEVHLHPQAQAALGTLFGSVAAAGRQLLVETHSDYIIDRVRMDVRDETTGLKPEDVSILYFEPGNLEVKIHSIRLDEMGNVLDAPPGYRQFFTDELMRSLGL